MEQFTILSVLLVLLFLRDKVCVYLRDALELFILVSF